MSWREPLISSTAWIAIFVIFTALLMLFAGYLFPAWKCDEINAVTGRKTQYRLISGCYVEVDGRWVPRDSWRGEQDR